MKSFSFFFVLLLGFGLAMAIEPTSPPPAPWQSGGAIGEISPMRSATLLIPYFEVDTTNVMGLNTLVAVTNVSFDPAVAHVTFWNVDGVSTLNFNIYLHGYDVSTFSVRDIFNGTLPNNGCASPNDTFTDQWIDCNGDGNYFNETPANAGLFAQEFQLIFRDNCNGFCDRACYEQMPADQLDYIRYMHTQCSFNWPSINYVGYITIDYAYTCHGGFPDDTDAYYAPMLDFQQTSTDNPTFEEDAPVLGYSNVFIGDYFYVDFDNNYAQGEAAVHIEAFGFGPDQNPSGYLGAQYYGMTNAQWRAIPLQTFYGKYLPFSAFVTAGQDQREPLPLGWGFRYIENSSFSGGTDALIWRSNNWLEGPWTFNDTQYYDCHSTMYDYWGTLDLSLPNPFFAFWDEEGNSATGPACVGCGSNFVVPVSTGRYDVEAIALPFEAGWIRLDFATDSRDNGLPNEPFSFSGAFDQSWVDVIYSALGKYSIGLSGQVLENNCSYDHSGGSGAISIIPND